MLILKNIGLQEKDFSGEESSITCLTQYLSKLTEPVDPGPSPPPFETREAKILVLEAEKNRAQSEYNMAQAEIQNPVVAQMKRWQRNKELEEIKKKNEVKILSFDKDINALKNTNSVEYKALEKQKKQYNLDWEDYQQKIVKFQEDTKKKEAKPDLIVLLNTYKALLETGERYKNSDTAFKILKRDLKVLVDKSKGDPLPAQQIYTKDSRFQEAERLVNMWNQESAVAAKVDLDLSAITARRQVLSGSKSDSDDDDDN